MDPISNVGGSKETRSFEQLLERVLTTDQYKHVTLIVAALAEPQLNGPTGSYEAISLIVPGQCGDGAVGLEAGGLHPPIIQTLEETSIKLLYLSVAFVASFLCNRITHKRAAPPSSYCRGEVLSTFSMNYFVVIFYNINCTALIER